MNIHVEVMEPFLTPRGYLNLLPSQPLRRTVTYIELYQRSGVNMNMNVFDIEAGRPIVARCVIEFLSYTLFSQLVIFSVLPPHALNLSLEYSSRLSMATLHSCFLPDFAWFTTRQLIAL